MSVANCPSCGAPVEFAIGSSAVVICGYCRSVVARTDRGIEAYGKVAALIDTGSPLRVGLAGKYQGQGFRITGRSQLRHQAGGVWDEWYAAFDDGRWGWLAEAQGRYYVTFKVGADAPPLDSLGLGSVVPPVDNLTVAEIGKAELMSAEGELPWRPEPGYEYQYADLTGTQRRFATIDYSEEPPVVFKGHEALLADLGLEEVVRRGAKVKAVALNCSKCGGPLDLKTPEAERIVCPNCGAAHDITAGKLQFFQMTKRKKIEPAIPLGKTGTVDGDAYVVAGFMERSVRYDITYYWTEYLLYNPDKGYRWLVNSDDHWSFVTPLRPGEVEDDAGEGVAKNVRYDGRTYKLFSNATARVTYVVGEFYWRVEVGEQVDTADYIAPPFGISKEVTRSGAKEISYSHARYMTRKEVESAFGVEDLPRPKGIGPMQPFPGPFLGKTWLLMFVLLLVVATVVAVAKRGKTLFDSSWNLAEVAPTPEAPNNVRVIFTDPFEVSGRDNLVIEGAAAVDNSWLYVGGDFVQENSGALESFDLPLEYFHGVDQGERWSEGSKNKRVYISRPAKGRYALRLETQWESGGNPPSLRVRVREGVFRWTHLVLALIAISIFPVLAVIRRIRWEMNRWKESSHSPFGQWEGTDDDDE